MREAQSSVLDELTDRVAPIPGVVGIILFGSVARGGADEYSDYDVLILFKDGASMKSGWDAVFGAIGPMNLNIHAVPETLEELGRANPVFLREVEEHGRVLYAREALAARIGHLLLKPFAIVSYDLSSLPYRGKMRVLYRLYERGEGGLVGESGGTKLGGGCVLVPREAGREIVDLMLSSGAKASRTDVFVEEHERQQRRPSVGDTPPRR